MKKYLYIFAIVTLMASCATQKRVGGAGDAPSALVDNNLAVQKINYLRKVMDNAVYSQNIVSKIDFTLNAMGKKTSVDGKLQMRKNEVVRITLSPLGIMEVGRLEFTPDGVLLVDRINKEYVQASYSDLDFLRDNGLDFYSLQALFWNQLFLPDVQRVSDAALRNFDVDMLAQNYRTVTMKSKDLHFTWTTDPKNAHITSAKVEYAKGASRSSVASWEYSNFTAVGKKSFPAQQVLSFSTEAMRQADSFSMTIKMKKMTTDSDWESRTTVSGKYTKVNAEDVLRQLMGM